MPTQALISIAAIALISLALVVASLKRLPDLGMLVALVIIAILVWRRPGGLEQIGFTGSDHWPGLILTSLLLGGLITVFAILIVEPLTERLTGRPHDISLIEHIRGDFKAMIQLLVLVWVLVAIFEEVVFRGFLMTEFAALAGVDGLALFANLAFSSALFGLAHSYQGRSGMLSTGIVGVLLGLIFVSAGFNLWSVILTHGFVDTLALLLIYANLDIRLKGAIFKPITK